MNEFSSIVAALKLQLLVVDSSVWCSYRCFNLPYNKTQNACHHAASSLASYSNNGHGTIAGIYNIEAFAFSMILYYGNNNKFVPCFPCVVSPTQVNCPVKVKALINIDRCHLIDELTS